tara:strand:+ start:2808 stop:3239 length:432 start_codon:yes stop_codon:yes gene_type:complete
MKCVSNVGDIVELCRKTNFVGLLKDLNGYNCDELKKIDSEVYIINNINEKTMKKFIHSAISNNLQLLILVREQDYIYITPKCNLLFSYPEYSQLEKKLFSKKCKIISTLTDLKLLTEALDWLGFDTVSKTDVRDNLRIILPAT